jgi:adenylate kinase family enzyme
VQRISVVGNSGSGKTTLAGELAAAMGIPHLELDSVFHQPNWEPLPREEFRAAVRAFVAGDSWVVDGNYSAIRDLVWARADTVVWMDPPRRRVMRRLLLRTLTRMARGTELWNGNREEWGNLLSPDPEKSILLWAWTKDSAYRDRYLAESASPANAHLRFVRLRSQREIAALISQTARRSVIPRPGSA